MWMIPSAEREVLLFSDAGSTLDPTLTINQALTSRATTSEEET